MTTRLPLEIEQLLADIGVIYMHRDLPSFTLAGTAEVPAELVQTLNDYYPMDDFGFYATAAISELMPNYERLRLRYLSEYSLQEDEGYLLLEGKVLFSFHEQDVVYQLLCEKGDFLRVPRDLLRWLDIGNKAIFSMIRCTQTENIPAFFYTGSNLSDKLPRLEFQDN
jgi:1,2-dihydroxy-3-keto-5-methylthiopentene dioxygenase